MKQQTTIHTQSTPEKSNNRVKKVGIDMGSHWEVAIKDEETGRYSHHKYYGRFKEDHCYMKVQNLIEDDYDLFVTYEAGRYGFTPARCLEKIGAEVRVIPVNKIQVVCSGKRVKTDKIDSRFLADLPWDDPNIPNVYIPNIEEESDRGLIREKNRIANDIRRNNNRILSILERWPMPINKKKHRTSEQWKEEMSGWEKQGWIGKSCLPLPEYNQIRNMVSCIELLESHQQSWAIEMTDRHDEQQQACHDNNAVCQVDILRSYKGIGQTISFVFSWLIGDFKRFKNAKHFTSYFGLTPTPWISCRMKHEQGISKAGNKELRRMAIQLAWLWVKWQPNSAITQKWESRLNQGGRIRRTAIVALARQLLESIYKKVVYGKEIEGATVNKKLVFGR